MSGRSVLALAVVALIVVLAWRHGGSSYEPSYRHAPVRHAHVLHVRHR